MEMTTPARYAAQAALYTQYHPHGTVGRDETSTGDGWWDATNHRDGYTTADRPAPCRHQTDNEALRLWLSHHDGTAMVSVDEVLMRLGRTGKVS